MSGFFVSALFGNLSDPIVDTLITRCHALFRQLDMSDDMLADMHRVLAFHGLPLSPGPARVSLAAARKECRRRLREFPIAGLLATSAQGDARDHDRLIGWTVAASLSLLARDPDHDSKIGSACAAVRLIAERQETGALAVFVGNTTSARSVFEAALAAEHTGYRHRYAIRFAPIRVLLESFLERKAAVTRDAELSDFEEIYHLTRSAPIPHMDLPDEIEGSSVTMITAAYLRSIGDEHNPEHVLHRLEADMPAVGTPAEKRNRPLQTVRRTRLLLDSMKRRLALPTHYGAFTSHEIRAVMAARSSLAPASAHPQWREHVLLLTSLVTGLTPETLLRMLKSKERPSRQGSEWLTLENGQLMVARDPQLARHRISERAAQLLQEKPQPLLLALPVEISQALLRLRSDPIRSYPSLGQVTAAFAHLMHTIGRPQTIRRMTSVIRDQMVGQGIDPVITAYVSGDSRHSLPALHYATVENGHVEAAYRAAVMSLPDAFFSWPPIKNHVIGSSLNIDRTMIKRFYEAADLELSSLARTSLRDLLLFHNRLATLVTTSLMLMSCHRPVFQPFERLTDYDPVRRWLFISDKEMRSVSAGRFVPVPEIFTQQLDAWFAHLRALALQLGPRGETDAARSCAKALSGKGELLFYLQEDGSTKKLRPLSIRPKTLGGHLDRNIWPLPLNWGRHVLRRLLIGFSPDLIDAFMGHADPGSEAFACHSGMTASDMEELRDALTAISCELGVQVFRGLR